MNAIRVTKINPEKVVRVYSGKPGCACGCRGKYTNRACVESQLRDWQRNTNDGVVNTIVRKMNRLLADGCDTDESRATKVVVGETFVSVEIADVRVYTAYFANDLEVIK